MMHAAKTHAWWVSLTYFRDISYVRHEKPPSHSTQVTFNSGTTVFFFRWPFLWFLDSGID